MPSSGQLLEAAYSQLGLRDGALLPALERPDDSVSQDDWLEKGEWLSLAKSVGAESVFFVRDNPVIVFARSNCTTSEELREVINRMWCLARPQHLFLAMPGELLVYDLTKPPIAAGESSEDQGRLLARVSKLGEVQSQLASYRRESLELGSTPKGEDYFSPGEARADKMLIRDLKIVRQALLDAGLNGPYAKIANALIGRSIFIRYLEDRRVLEKKDFQNVASKRKRWVSIIESHPSIPIEDWMQHINYTKVLSDKDFTYALFDEIGQEFNGDLFPVSDEERLVVESKHLRLLQRFLQGEIADQTKPLFFFAYRFDIIPIELISSIYEEFYNAESGGDNQGSHYTPIELVEYLLSKVLTLEVLDSNPTILDPACGSGIFLVEAFRRIVRFRQFKNRRRLGLPELRKIIRDQLRGIDINDEAVSVAAFSLYLSLLHHVDPPDIWREKKLPNLTYVPSSGEGPQRFNILLATNAFTTESYIQHDRVHEKFAPGAIDVVVGNPPWGYPKKTDPIGSQEAKKAIKWCAENKLSVGDNELSQAFIHRALEFLRMGGTAGLLVSTGVFFKVHPKSRKFRRQWLSQVELSHVVNFAAVRHLFFNSGIAPFASIVFSKSQDIERESSVEYWSAKHTIQAKQLRAVVLSISDRKVFSQSDAFFDERVWKTYWWGNHHDYSLIQWFSNFETIEQVVVDETASEEKFGRGTQSGSDDSPVRLRRLKVLKTRSFERYGSLKKDDFEKPLSKYRARTGLPPWSIFEGRRLLVKRGISQARNQNGRIISRLASTPFAFKHSIHGIDVSGLPDWQSKVMLGCLWSSIARYYFWMTSGSWDAWYPAIDQKDLRGFPIAFPESERCRNQIVRVVDNLSELGSKQTEMVLQDPKVEAEIRTLENELDDLMFSNYRLSTAQRQLVTDMCEFGLDLFHRRDKSIAVKRIDTSIPKPFGTSRELSNLNGSVLGDYLDVLLKIWNQELSPDGEFTWRVISTPITKSMIAVILETQSFGADVGVDRSSNEAEWRDVLKKLDSDSLQHDGSRRVFIDGTIRAVGETDVIIVKRNEHRHWTASMAREDAEATIKMAIDLQEVK